MKSKEKEKMKFNQCKEKSWIRTKYNKIHIKIREFGKTRYRSKEYWIFLYKIPKEINWFSAGQFMKLGERNVVAVNSRIYKKITKSEFRSIVKHEILHDIMGHRDEKVSRGDYIQIHKKLWSMMSKQDLINELAWQQR